MLVDVVGLIGEYCITLDEGRKLYERIHPRLKAGEHVSLNFLGVRVFASPFFNAAFGELTRDIKSEQLNELLSIVNMSPSNQDTLRLVVENGKRYHHDARFRKASDEVSEHLNDR